MLLKKPALTVMEMADVVEATKAIENIMGRYTFLNCYKRTGEHFEKYWSKNDPVITLNDCKYVGLDAVKAYFVDYNDQQTKWANEVMRKLHPEELGGKSDEEVWAVGSNTVLTMTTPIIEVARDGKTAKGLWYIMGSETEVYEGGSKANWNFGRCACDFVKEADGWKLWHMLVFTDFRTPLGGNWATDAVAPRDGVAAPAPTEKGEFYHAYDNNFISLVDPPLPEPYDSFDETFAYIGGAF